jgi:hypothetical protein
MLSNEEIFIQYVKDECKKHGIKCSLRNTKFVSLGKGSKCSGYFDSANKILVCSMNRLDAIEILVHEYCHLTQWVENIAIWRICDELNTFQLMDEWLQGNEVKNIKKVLSYNRDLELDNEKRSVEMCKRFNLNVDLIHYAKKANSYIYFYNWMKESRRWCKPLNSPYKNTRLIEAMPEHFNNNYNVLPAKLRAIFKSEGI